MKKIIIILIPLTIILAIFSIANDKNLSFMDILGGIKTINFKEFNYEQIKQSWDNLNMSNVWDNVGIIWENSNNFLEVLFAIQITIDAVAESIEKYFVLFFDINKFIFEFIWYLISNLIELFKFVINYIIG